MSNQRNIAGNSKLQKVFKNLSFVIGTVFVKNLIYEYNLVCGYGMNMEVLAIN